MNKRERIEDAAGKYASRTEFGEVIFPEVHWQDFVTDLATPPQASPATGAQEAAVALIDRTIGTWREYDHADVVNVVNAALTTAQPAPQEAQPVSAEPNLYKRALEAIIANPGGASAKRIATLALGLDGTETVKPYAAPQPASAGAVELSDEAIDRISGQMFPGGNLREFARAIIAAMSATTGEKEGE